MGGEASMEVQILENEYWWGSIVDIGMDMPWDRSSVCTVDPSTMGRDQRSPLFLSNLGRCVWSEKPFVMNLTRVLLKSILRFILKPVAKI